MEEVYVVPRKADLHHVAFKASTPKLKLRARSSCRQRRCRNRACLGIDAIEHNPKHCDNDETEHAAFGPYRSAAQPWRAVQRRTQQVTGPHLSTGGYGVEESFSPIPESMKADGKPEIAGAPQCEAEEESDECRGEQASPLLAFIPPMYESKQTRHDHGCRPETDAARQSELRVAAQKELLEQPHQQKHDAPEQSEP